MEAFFSWVAAGFGALFVVAVAVAWWEHLVRNARPPVAFERAAAHVLRVDVPLDTTAGLLLPNSDSDERRATLGGAMERMGRVGRAARSEGAVPPDAWTETSPMVLHPAPEADAAAPPPPTSRV